MGNSYDWFPLISVQPLTFFDQEMLFVWTAILLAYFRLSLFSCGCCQAPTDLSMNSSPHLAMRGSLLSLDFHTVWWPLALPTELP